MNARFFLCLIVSFSLAACGGKKERTAVDWGDVTEHYLNGQQVSIKLPSEFKESSRYRISSDVAALKKDKSLSNIVESALEQFEETDNNIDIFVDTSSQYHFVAILDSDELIPIDQTTAARLGKLLMEDYEKMDFSRKGLEVKRLESNIKKNTEQSLAKFKFEILNKRKKDKSYANTFFVTNSTRTLIIHEFSSGKEDLEFFTWSINENY